MLHNVKTFVLLMNCHRVRQCDYTADAHVLPL